MNFAAKLAVILFGTVPGKDKQTKDKIAKEKAKLEREDKKQEDSIKLLKRLV